MEQVRSEGLAALARARTLDDPDRQLDDDDVTAAIERVSAEVAARVGGHLRR